MLEKTKEVLEIICNDDLFKNFDIRFVGGTALSYRINHRLSEDLDFATLNLSPKESNKFKTRYLESVKQIAYFQETLQRAKDSKDEKATLFQKSNRNSIHIFTNF